MSNSFWQPAPLPPTKLGRYRILSPKAAVRVSPIQLGGMNIGDKWQKVMGAMDKESSFQLLDTYFNAGGNFIDTANNYQDETSEMFIGEWAEKRGIRDQLVIATKYTSHYKRGDKDIAIKMNYTGNSVKNLNISVEASLKKLRTTYIDILYVHWWAYDASIEEVMSSLHNLVVAGKVLYLGISDTPAWVVASANQWARCHGKTPFSIYQGQWNIFDRSLEHEILPMCRAEGLAIAPWGVLAGGRLRTDDEEKRRKETGENGRTMIHPTWERTPAEAEMCKKLEEIAKKVGAKHHLCSYCISYASPYVFPILGGRKIEHLYENLEALDIQLTADEMKELDLIAPIRPGFPHTLIGDGSRDPWVILTAGITDRWQTLPSQPKEMVHHFGG